MFKELELITLAHEIKKYGLEEGDIGTVVDVSQDKKRAMVEFMDKVGKTIAVIDLDSSDIKQNAFKAKTKNNYEKAPDYQTFVMRDKKRKTN